MNRQEFYTVGARVRNSQGNGFCEGIYAFGSFRLPYVLTDLSKARTKDCIYVIKGKENAEEFVRHLSRTCRYEFRKRAKQENFDVGEQRIYAIKLTNKIFDGFKFPSELGEQNKVHTKKKSKHTLRVEDGSLYKVSLDNSK